MARDKKRLGEKLKSPRKAAPSRRSSEAKSRPARGRSGKSQQTTVTKLARELGDARQQQSATAKILKVIASSRSDVQPVFDVIVQTSRDLCRSQASTIFILRDGKFHVVAFSGVQTKLLQHMKDHPISIDQKGSALARAAREKRTIHIPNTLEDAELVEGGPISIGRPRATLTVPLVRDGEVIGGITLRQSYLTPYTPRQIEAIEAFADQAVIAIENGRLFNETKEALERQTATADVLKVISRSAFDLQTVLDTLVESAARLCEAEMAFIHRREGEQYRAAATFGFSPEFWAFMQAHPISPGRGSIAGRVALERHAIQIEDVAVDPEYTLSQATSLARQHTTLGVPLLRENELIGVIVLARQRVELFTEKQIALVTTFADQAVIAIENVRLFDEVQAKTRDLEESLQQQTASAEVLQVINSSPGDLAPIFDVMLQKALSLCGAAFGQLVTFDGVVFRAAAWRGYEPGPSATAPLPGMALHQLVHGAQIVHIPDITADDVYRSGNPVRRRLADKYGGRTAIWVALRKDEELLGAFVIFRTEVRPFSDKQIALLQGFAAQAVTAIENARLLSELRQSLQQQTATADVLRIISRSTFDLKSVLNTLVKSAARLCEADVASIPRLTGAIFDQIASYGYSSDFHEFLQNNPIVPGRGTASGRAVTEGKTVHFPDVLADPEYDYTEGQKVGGFRTLLGVPLMREGAAIGALVLGRSEPRPFTPQQIELVETFADQAAIAIENARLFEAEQQRTRELGRSLEDLRTTQDRLVQTQKLASLGQLTAGIAHEIKNPLNFVNNFSAVSVELIDELLETLGRVTADRKTREEIAELANTLRDNLDKIVQHGMRADSIVKNMLLHSREGSGESRSVDVNAIVEESLNLAYHGARAEKAGFSITLKRDLDPGAGALDLYPQEIIRALLNLISNGFYAATRRKVEAVDGTFEPVLSAATRNLGKTVEIRIRDNGTGIPPEVRQKIFNPFFTTKPTGEGTGLGLSMTHDIIVKQHGGTIDVETEPGVFTEFIITLPRGNASGSKSE
jgi:two-component system, NtrC family, sensor kinase